MNLLQRTTNAADAPATTPRLFVLSLSAGLVLSMKPDGSDQTTIASGGHMPDGVAIDAAAGHVYWTNMGLPHLDDGSIERCDADGGNRITVVPPGVTHTPKQLHLDRAHGKLYWADREGMRVMRANLDGSQVEILVVAGDPEAQRGDATRWCVGIALDHAKSRLYWTQKGADNAGAGRIYRAGIEIPMGENAVSRSDIEVWKDGLPEPIDLEFDPTGRALYWTDRGDPPAGNTVNRAAVDADPREPPQVLISHLMEGIGLALDVAGDRLFVTDLGGSVYTARLDGSDARALAFAQGNLSGVAYAELATAKA
jgi:DNA-binding beta-propeller fold protein YncE